MAESFFKKLFAFLFKNTFVFIISGVIGVVLSELYIFYVWLPVHGADIGLAIIGLFPVMMILFALIGVIIGGPIGVIIYNIFKRIKKKKKD